MNKEEIILEVLEWFDESSLDEQNRFKNCEFDSLYEYHHSLGRSIRNQFKLWDNPWTPELVDGVDCSLNHPDAVSMSIIEEVWKRIK